jgi:NitT/TauT family transport system substrate-binding protein
MALDPTALAKKSASRICIRRNAMSQKSSACRWLAGFVHFGLSSRAATFALVVVWSGAFAAHASAEKLVIAEGAHVIGYLAVYIAKDEGYFTQEGLDVDIVPTRGSAQAVAAIIGGGADVALATVSDVANAVSEGRNLKVIAGITNQPQMMLTVSTEFAKKHNITAQSPLDQRLKALKGGTFAVSAPGSMTDDVMKTLLTMGGFSPDRDAQIMALGGAGSEMLGALARNSIDGFVLSPPAGNQAEADGKGIILVNLMAGEIPKYRDMMFQAIASTPATIAEKKETLIKFTRAIARAQKLMMTDKESALALGAKAFPNIDPPVFKSAFNIAYPSFSENPIVPLPSVQKALDSTPTKEKVPADQIVDNSIAKAVL